MSTLDQHIHDYLIGRYFDQRLSYTPLSLKAYLHVNHDYVRANIENGLHKCTEHCKQAVTRAEVIN